ncbi:MAG: hypothetical protein D6690_01350 [Nitrospirae bacterium]|nr:MAG: hypothetical protein D6690_01350 [Nitrospirota bacterium]
MGWKRARGNRCFTTIKAVSVGCRLLIFSGRRMTRYRNLYNGYRKRYFLKQTVMAAGGPILGLLEVRMKIIIKRETPLSEGFLSVMDRREYKRPR